MHARLQNEYISVRNTIFYYLSDVLYVTPNRTCFFSGFAVILKVV